MSTETPKPVSPFFSYFYLSESSRFDVQFCACDSVWGGRQGPLLDSLRYLSGLVTHPHLGEGGCKSCRVDKAGVTVDGCSP